MKKPNISQKSVLLAFSGVIVVIYLNIANAEIKEIVAREQVLRDEIDKIIKKIEG